MQIFRDHPLTGVALIPSAKRYAPTGTRCCTGSGQHRPQRVPAYSRRTGIAGVLTVSGCYWRWPGPGGSAGVQRQPAPLPGGGSWVSARPWPASRAVDVETFVEPAILLPVVLFAAQILALSPGREKPESRPRRWIWAAALALLAAGAVGMAWDAWARLAMCRAWPGFSGVTWNKPCPPQSALGTTTTGCRCTTATQATSTACKPLRAIVLHWQPHWNVTANA